MKILIMGYGRHGKDTVASMIAQRTGLKWGSSSMVALHHAVWPVMSNETIYEGEYQRYESPAECFADRHNRRAEWHELIKQYNTPDKARLAKDVLSEYDMYVGMRCQQEFYESRDLFDLVIWVDASLRHEDEPGDSCTVDWRMADIVINNNRSLDDLRRTIRVLFPARLQMINKGAIVEVVD